MGWAKRFEIVKMLLATETSWDQKGSLRNPKFWPEYRLKRSVYAAWIRIRPPTWCAPVPPPREDISLRYMLNSPLCYIIHSEYWYWRVLQLWKRGKLNITSRINENKSVAPNCICLMRFWDIGRVKENYIFFSHLPWERIIFVVVVVVPYNETHMLQWY